MFQRLTLPIAASALVLGTFALAQSQPSKSKPVSAPITAIGIVVGAPYMTDNRMEFNLRTSAGLYRVRPHSKAQMKEIRGGDRIRAYGRPLGKVIYGANVKLLEARASTRSL